MNFEIDGRKVRSNFISLVIKEIGIYHNGLHSKELKHLDVITSIDIQLVDVMDIKGVSN